MNYKQQLGLAGTLFGVGATIWGMSKFAIYQGKTKDILIRK